MRDELISVIDAAKEIGKRKQTIFKVLKRLGITTIKQRHSGHKGQKVSYVTMKEFKRIADYFASVKNSNEKADAEIKNKNKNEDGVFYLIQLEPTHDQGRFKVGFSSSMQERLRHLKCSAPLLTLIATWPCRSLWEKTVIDCIVTDCEQIHTEVFRTDNIKKIREKCNQFFALMPKN